MILDGMMIGFHFFCLQDSLIKQLYWIWVDYRTQKRRGILSHVLLSGHLEKPCGKE